MNHLAPAGQRIRLDYVRGGQKHSVTVERYLPESTQQWSLRARFCLTLARAGIDPLFAGGVLDAPEDAGAQGVDGGLSPLVTSWVSDGANVTVTTTPRDGETEPELEERHADAVAAAQLVFPPDP